MKTRRVCEHISALLLILSVVLFVGMCLYELYVEPISYRTAALTICIGIPALWSVAILLLGPIPTLIIRRREKRELRTAQQIRSLINTVDVIDSNCRRLEPMVLELQDDEHAPSNWYDDLNEANFRAKTRAMWLEDHDAEN